MFAQGIYENLCSLQVFVCQNIWSFCISFLYDITFWRIFSKKKKISNHFYNYFLKCTLFSPIFMQTANAFYASAQMLKFKNDFTKCLSLQRDPKDTYSFTMFYFSKILTLYVFSTKYSVFLMVLRENKILLQVWHTTLNFFTHNLNKHP